MRAPDANMIRLLCNAAFLVRRGDALDTHDAHRVSKTSATQCARCGDPWPCHAERHALKFDRATDQLRADSRTRGAGEFEALVRRVRGMREVAVAFAKTINLALRRAPSIDYGEPVRAVLTASGMDKS